MLCNLRKRKNIAIGVIELKLKDNTNKTNRDDECELRGLMGKLLILFFM